MELRDLPCRASAAERLLKAMASASRLPVLCELVQGERTVAELHQTLGVGMSTVSPHLAQPRRAGIVEARREVRAINYPLAGEAAARRVVLPHATFCPPGRRERLNKEKTS